MLDISDGTEALLESLSADPERFMACRTIGGLTLDPLGEFNKLQALVRGVVWHTQVQQAQAMGESRANG